MQVLPVVLAAIFTAFILMLVGVLVMFISMLRERTEGSGKRGDIEGGAVIIVGPLPVVIGTSQRVSKLLMVLAIALLLVSVLTYLILSRGVIR